jgi:hypothetical protein
MVMTVDSQLWRHVFAQHTDVKVTDYITLTVGDFCNKTCKDPRDKVYGLMVLVQLSSQVEIDYTKSTRRVFLDAVVPMVREYWYTRHEPSDSGCQSHRVRWALGKSVESSWSLAQAMDFTDLEKYEVTAKSRGLRVDAETHCITPVGYEPATRQVSINKRLEATCNRWWYTFEGNRYYHDCKEWSSNAKLQEYTVPEDVRYSSPGLARNCPQETIGFQSSVSFFSKSHRVP